MKKYQQHSKGIKAQRGFTIIELVIVMVILGILAASALPRFVNLSEDARRSSIMGLEGSLKSAAAMAYARAIISQQNGPTGEIIVDGQTIALVNGYPAAGSIFNMLADVSGYSMEVSGNSVSASNGSAVSATCKVTYTEAVQGEAPVVNTVTDNCS